VAVALWGAVAHAEGLVRPLEGADVDWSAGTISARGGAAADYRLPSADVARPSAERRARAAAAQKLKGALAALSIGGGRKLSAADIDAAVKRARAAVDYQSNGGALVTLALRFADVLAPARAPEAAPERALVVSAMPLELAPKLAAGEAEGALAWAVYRAGSPPSGVTATAAKRDRQGRLVLPKGEGLGKLSSGPAIIYVQKILK
jgi:hypothetical protein